MANSQKNQAEKMDNQENKAEKMDTQENQTEQAPTYGGCVGPESAYVLLRSGDGHEFIIKRSHALQATTLKSMLCGPGQSAEDEVSEVDLKEIPSHVLQRVCDYLVYKARYTNSSTRVPEFEIGPEIALELLMAANFLDC